MKKAQNTAYSLNPLSRHWAFGDTRPLPRILIHKPPTYDSKSNHLKKKKTNNIQQDPKLEKN